MRFSNCSFIQKFNTKAAQLTLVDIMSSLNGRMPIGFGGGGEGLGVGKMLNRHCERVGAEESTLEEPVAYRLGDGRPPYYS